MRMFLTEHGMDAVLEDFYNKGYIQADDVMHMRPEEVEELHFLSTAQKEHLLQLLPDVQVGGTLYWADDYGKVSEVSIRNVWELSDCGELHDASRVWQEGMENWANWADCQTFFPRPPPAQTVDEASRDIFGANLTNAAEETPAVAVDDTLRQEHQRLREHLYDFTDGRLLGGAGTNLASAGTEISDGVDSRATWIRKGQRLQDETRQLEEALLSARAQLQTAEAEQRVATLSIVTLKTEVMAKAAEAKAANDRAVEATALVHEWKASTFRTALVMEGFRPPDSPPNLLPVDTDTNEFGEFGLVAHQLLQVRKTPSWPRNWGNFSLL
jgi:hypothetical protein